MKNKELSKDYKKTKNIINIISSVSIVILGCLFFIVPRVSEMEPNKILFIAMLIYFGIKISEYILTRKSRDSECIWVAIASFLAATAGLEYGEIASNILVSISLSVWILILTIVKLIKINEYRYAENTLMYLNIVTMSLFLLSGVLSVITIYQEAISINMILGYFFAGFFASDEYLYKMGSLVGNNAAYGFLAGGAIVVAGVFLSMGIRRLLYKKPLSLHVGSMGLRKAMQ